MTALERYLLALRRLVADRAAYALSIADDDARMAEIDRLHGELTPAEMDAAQQLEVWKFHP